MKRLPKDELDASKPSRKLNRATRRAVAKSARADKAGCCVPGCRRPLSHRDMVDLDGFAAHTACRNRYSEAQQKRRAEQLGLSVVESGDLLAKG